MGKKTSHLAIFDFHFFDLCLGRWKYGIDLDRLPDAISDHKIDLVGGGRVGPGSVPALLLCNLVHRRFDSARGCDETETEKPDDGPCRRRRPGRGCSRFSASSQVQSHALGSHLVSPGHFLQVRNVEKVPWNPIVNWDFLRFCREAKDSTFTSEHELFNILGHSGGIKVQDISQDAIKNSEHMPRCFTVQDLRHPCICSLRICMDW